MNKKIIAFPWYGGKYTHLDFILSHIPRNARHFLDVYGGSGAVLLNLSRYPQETYNDLNSDLVNFFQVLRDNPEELQRGLFFTPYSRAEYETACKARNESITDKIEAARCFLVRTVFAIGGMESSDGASWSYSKSNSDGRKHGAKQAYAFLDTPDRLKIVINRIKNVNIENLPAVELIEKHDSPDTLFYLDPPYVHSSRKDTKSYTYEMTDSDHRELGEVLNGIQGRAVLSGYKCDLYDEIFSGWNRFDDKIKIAFSAIKNKTEAKKYRQESIWINF